MPVRIVPRRLLVVLLSLVTSLLSLQSPAPAPKNIKVYLIGDSTMSVKDPRAYPETGWGMPFASFFDDTVTIDNRAKNGRSTRTFISENLWQPVAGALQEGDYVFIQFGHNDESKEKTDRYASPEEYKNNLLRFVTETRNKKAFPILITPVARRKFDSAGRVVETHQIYSDLVRALAQEQNVPLIDLDQTSQALLQQYGDERSKELFNWLKPGQQPNYPDGREDNTHFNQLGALVIARLVFQDIKVLHLELADRARKADLPPAVLPAHK